MYCTTHDEYFHAEINEKCPGCLKKQMECKHLDKGPDKLFGSRKYFGLTGEWDVCYDCDQLIKVE